MDKREHSKVPYTRGYNTKTDKDAVFELKYDYLMYLNQFINIALSLGNWEVPKTVSSRYLELSLMLKGMVAVFEDEEMGLLALPCNRAGNVDAYGDPVKVRAYGRNGYVRNLLNHVNCVVIYNDLERTAMINNLEWYAKRLFGFDELIQLNCDAQTMPYLLEGTKGQELTLRNLFSKIRAKCPVIFKSSTADYKINVLNTNTPFVADKLNALKQSLWNECMTFIGVPNVTYEKAERIIRDEAQQMLGGTKASVQSRIDAREQGVKEVNEMFDANFNYTYDFKLEGGNNNGKLYSRDSGIVGEP